MCAAPRGGGREVEITPVDGEEPDGWGRLVGAADDVAEEESAHRGPDEGEAISDGGYGRGAGNPHDGRPGDAADHPDEDCTEEVAGVGDEPGDEAGHPADRTDDGERLPGGCV